MGIFQATYLLEDQYHLRDPEVVRNYQQCVGACMYLTCFTRGDCSFAVNQCARFMHNPGPTHIAAIKRVLRYLAGTRDRGITYRRDTPDISATIMGHHVTPNQLKEAPKPGEQGSNPGRGQLQGSNYGDRCRVRDPNAGMGVLQGNTGPAARQDTIEPNWDRSG